MVYAEYTWIFVVALPIAFIAAFGIGANDVANSFGSSVGTKAITMWQAVLIAAVCEWSGAFFLGASVASTIKGGIADTEDFVDMPEVFMYGFLCVLCTAALWDNLACHLELPVSTTHTTVGGVVGFALVAAGTGGVIWVQSKDEFPYFSGFVSVLASWVVSPLAAGLVVSIMFFFIRTFILRSKHSFTIAFWTLPLFTGALFGLIVGFIIQTGEKNGNWEEHSDGWVAWVSTCFAVGAALLTLIVVMPLLKKKAIREDAALQSRIAELQASKDSAAAAKEADLKNDSPTSGDVSIDLGKVAGATNADARKHVSQDGVDPELLAKAMYDLDMTNHSNGDWTDKVAEKYHAWVADSKWGQAVFQNRVAKILSHGLFYDVHDAVAKDQHVANVWANAEVFDFKTERLFRYLQVFSAMAMSFAHGSNDVANAMGPLTAIYQTWDTSEVPGSKTTVPDWILALGGAGIVVGLATYGYKIMRVLGVKSVKLTNVRGFVVEYATALTVCVSSRYGLPVSTTQVVSGAILSMGLWEGRKGVNWRVALRIGFGWVLTVFIAVGVSALLTALGIYSPNVNATNNQFNARNTVNALTLSQIQYMNDTGAVPESTLQAYNDTLTQMYLPVTNMTGSADLQTEVFNTYNTSLF